MARVLICKRSDIKEGELTNVKIGGRHFLVTSVGGTFFAISSICALKSSESPEGELDNAESTCPCHGARWNATNEKLTGFSEFLKPLESYEVITENDALFVEI